MAVTKIFAKVAGGDLDTGEFGPRFIPHGRWTHSHAQFVCDHSILELYFNTQLGFISTGNYDFLSELKIPLTALKIIDPSANELGGIQQHSAMLRSVDLSFVGRLTSSIDFESFYLLERLSILVRIPRMHLAFECHNLKTLALSRYPSDLTEKEFSGVPGLTELFLSSVNLSSVRPLANLALLEKLTISAARGFTSLEGIGGMDQLKTLRIESCKGLYDFSEMKNLRNLQNLWLLDCGEIDSIDSLKNLSNLRRLEIVGNTKIKDGDLSKLRELPKLETLCIVDRPHYRPQASAINT